MAAGAQIAPVVDVPLSLFSGMDPELSPPDCPEGISPDNQDMIYVPGNTASRPCLSRLLTNALTGETIPTVVYHKTFIQPNELPLTLILDSNGQFWVENVAISPGVATQLPATTQPGLYAQSISAFGREYIAISDLLHGQGVPLQYDGTYLDRVSMDGPGASPTVADTFQTAAISEAGLDGPEHVISSIVENGNVATATTTSAHGYVPGQTVFVTANVSGYNGLQIASTVPSTTSFTFVLNATGLSSATGGSVQPAIGFANFESVISPAPQVGDSLTITGTGTALDNSAADSPTNWPIIGVTQGVVTTVLFSLAAGNPAGTYTGGSAGTGVVGGQSTVGVHQVVCMWLTRQGFLSEPSPPINFVSVGNSKWQVSNLPIGPSNVIARYLGFTGAGGDNFFTIPANVTLPNLANPLGTPITVLATVIPDNVSTSAIINFGDNTLFAALAIDQTGNDLFDQCVLGPCAGFFAYDARLFPWGEWNKIENFLNMGFCGGYGTAGGIGVLTLPLGWAISANGTTGGPSTGGLLVPGAETIPVRQGNGQVVNTTFVNGPWAGGMVWQVTGDGTLARKGALQQSAYQDAYGDPIIQPNTQYYVRAWLSNPSGLPNGGMFFQLSSASTGFQVYAIINAAAIPAGGGFVTATFAGPTPAVIPDDFTLVIYDYATAAGQVLYHGELELIYAQNPYRDTEARASYVLNPEAFAQTTGAIGPEDDESPIRCFSLQRNSVLLKTAQGTHTFQANDYEPDQWEVSQLSRSVGCCSIRGGDPGQFGTGDAAEDWDLSFHRNGLYLFAGGEFWKVSQEMQPAIDALNWAAQQCFVVKNDVNTRRAYLLVANGIATAPNLVLVMDYRELDTAQQIAASPPVHISLTGKMICSDLTRKWSRWNITANTAEVLVRPGLQAQMTFGGGNGAAPGTAAGFGNLYTLSSLKYTDDDYGQMFPSYTTYFFLNHEMEQMLGVGAHRKLFKKVCMYVSGIGNVFFTPLVDSLENALPNSSTRQLVANSSPATALTQDLEWTIGVRGERVAFKIQVSPLAGQTDVQIQLSKLIVTVTQDPIALTRSSRL